MSTQPQDRGERPLVPKPTWVIKLEEIVGSKVRVHPNLLSATKLFIITPLTFLALRQVDILPNGPALIGSLLLAFVFFDYLDGVVARAQNLETKFGRFFDRITDYPLLFVVSYFCVDFVPMALLATKIGLDIGLFVLYSLGRGSTENRLRTTISYATLISLLFLSQGWLAPFITRQVVEILLWCSIAFSGTVALYNLDLLQKRFIADLLSASNLLCGIFSMVFASRGQLEFSLLLLILGAAFDGFDGAAARRWGGTRWGVYSDDIADGVNYGIAPGVAIYFTIGGAEGALIGALFSAFTISRLIFFTLNKENSDPNYFLGVPSTTGGLITMCSLILFSQHLAILGLMVGAACVQMVSFTTHYRHLGRAFGSHKRRALFGTPIYLLVLVLGALFWGRNGPVSLILAANLIYGFWPVLDSFKALDKSET